MIFGFGFINQTHLFKRTVNYSTQLIKKRPELLSCTWDDIQFFISNLGQKNVKCDNLDSYNIDFMKWYKGAEYF